MPAHLELFFSCLLRHTAWHLLRHIYNLVSQDYSWLIHCLFQRGTRPGVGLSWPQPAASSAEWGNIYSAASCIFQLTLSSVTTQFIPLQVYTPLLNVFLVWPAWQYLHVSPAFLCSRWILPCHSQHYYMEVVFAAPLSGLTPLLLPLCLQLLVLAVLAGRISLNVPPSVWHGEVFLGARKMHFVKCSLLLFLAEMKVSGLWPCLLAGNCRLPPRRLEALWHRSILLSGAGSHPLSVFSGHSHPWADAI